MEGLCVFFRANMLLSERKETRTGNLNHAVVLDVSDRSKEFFIVKFCFSLGRNKFDLPRRTSTEKSQYGAKSEPVAVSVCRVTIYCLRWLVQRPSSHSSPRDTAQRDDIFSRRTPDPFNMNVLHMNVTFASPKVLAANTHKY